MLTNEFRRKQIEDGKALLKVMESQVRIGFHVDITGDDS
jgi:hypothetical protein